jgi:hypothetical protein
MLERDEIDALFRGAPAGPAVPAEPAGELAEPEHWERRYPPRELPPGAMVTRFSPSPTGAAHLGGVYVAMLDKDLARNSGGVYFIRVEDTDQARTVEGALAQFDTAFSYFGVHADETAETGAYGPYTQSRRAAIYCASPPGRSWPPPPSSSGRRRCRPGTTAAGRCGGTPPTSRSGRRWPRAGRTSCASAPPANRAGSPSPT